MRRFSIFVAFAILFASSSALAQLPPTTTFGLDFQANNQQSVAPTNQARLRYNTITGQLEQSVSSSGYLPVIPTNGLAFYNVKDYGAKGNGTTDDTTAILAAVAAAGPYSVIFFPKGVYLITSTITIANNYMHVLGSGTGTTQIIFNPTANATLFVFSAVPIQEAGTSIEKMLITSTDTTHQKIGVDVQDVDQFYAQDVWINNGWMGNGTNNIGYRLRGRQSHTWSRIRAFVDTPFEIASDPDITTPVNNDHMHIQDTYFVASPANANLLIDDGIVITNLTIDGENGWNFGKYGLYWKTTVNNSTVSSNIKISGVRFERPDDPTGWGIYIERSGASLELQNVLIEDYAFSPFGNGAFVQNVKNLTFQNCLFTAGAGLSHLDVSTGIFELLLLNNYVNGSATVNFGTLVQEFGLPLLRATSGQPMPSTASYYDDFTSANRPVVVSGFGFTEGVLDLLSTGTMQLGSTNTSSIIVGTAAASTATVEALLPKLLGSDVVNGSYPRTATVNTYTGGNPVFGVLNGNTLVFNITATGAVQSLNGTYEPTGVTQLNLGTGVASAVRIGQNATQTTLASNTIVQGDATTTSRLFQTGFQPAAGSGITVGTFTLAGAPGAASDGTAAAGVAGEPITIRSGNGGNGSGAFAPGNGQNTSFLGGNAGTSGTGNASGGDAVIDGGSKSGTGTAGRVQVGTSANTSAVNIGVAGNALTISDIMQTGLPAKANNTIASATTIAPTAYITHITGTTSITTITPPTTFAQANGGGIILLIFDSTVVWTASGATNGIIVGGTNTTAGSSVEFVYDNATQRWYPSRIQ